MYLPQPRHLETKKIRVARCLPRPGPRQSTEVEQLDTVCSEVMGMLYLIWGFRCLGVTDRLCRPHVLIIVDVWSYHDSLSLMFVHDGATHMQQTHTHGHHTTLQTHTCPFLFAPPSHTHIHTDTSTHMHTHAHCTPTIDSYITYHVDDLFFSMTYRSLW